MRRVTWCTVLSGEFFPSHVFCGTNLTGKTWSADKDHLGQNDRQLTLYTLVNVVGPSDFSSNAFLTT